MGRGASLAITAVAMLLVSCQSAGSAGLASSGSAAASPSATIPPSTLLVLADRGPGTSTQPWVLHLIRPDGKEASQLTLKAGSRAERAAGSRIFVLSDSSDSIKAVHKDGTVEDLGSAGAGGARAFAASPDGTRWMWSTADSKGSQVHLAGDGMTPRVVAQSAGSGHEIQPYSWTRAGAFLVDEPEGGGAYQFNPALKQVSRVDMNTMSAKPVPGTDQCQFSDMSADRTIACFIGGRQAPASLVLIAANGKRRMIPLATPRFNEYGGAFFAPDGRLLTVAGATGASTQNQPEQYGIDLVTVKDASIKRLGLDGVRPSDLLQQQTWLPGDSLVVYRPGGDAGGPAGVFLVRTDGTNKRLATGDLLPIGVLTG